MKAGAMPTVPGRSDARGASFWLLNLRWAAAAGQAVTVIVVHWRLGIPVALPPVFALIGALLLTNAVAAGYERWRGALPEWVPPALCVLDVLQLTALLYFTGGPYNPFSFLYLVTLALAAMILNNYWAWELCLLSVACYAALFFDHRDLGITGDPRHDASLHVQGMFVAYVVAAVVTTFFASRMSQALAGNEQELAKAREREQRARQLALVAGLTAGTAHELSTPLTTIAVVAKEMERKLHGEPLATDARLIREQVERCRGALNRIAVEFGQAKGESPAAVPLRALAERAREGLRHAERVQLEASGLWDAKIRTYPDAISQALRQVLKNALDASPDGQPVRISAAREDGRVRIEVTDQGPGMDREVLSRAAEPFFSTKEAGLGMGIGLFLAASVVEEMGGGLRLVSGPGMGTTVTLELPWQPAPSAGEAGRAVARA